MSGFEAAVDVALECLDIIVNAFHFFGNLDALWAMLDTLSAADAVVGLAQLGYATIIPDEEGLAGTGIVGILAVSRQIILGNALVVVGEHARDIDTIGARHAVFAVIAGNGIVVHNLLSDAIKEFLIFVVKFLERAIGTQILLEVLHVGHATEDGEHSRE